MKVTSRPFIVRVLVAAVGVIGIASTQADTLSYTHQHVIVKDDRSAAQNRPEKVERIESAAVQIGNFKIEVPSLVTATMASTSPPASSKPPRHALFVLNANRALSATDEARFRAWTGDGAAQVWVARDAMNYVRSMLPPPDGTEDVVHQWLPCSHGCENWVWIER